MEEIEVGEYVRTDNGKIYHFTDRTKKGRSIMFADNIVKHSFNIIDLLVVGDYVNGHRVYRIDNNVTIWLETETQFYCGIYEKDIKSIVTKEMFENIKYKLEK